MTIVFAYVVTSPLFCRTKTVVFSKNAVICERDCKLAILFRVGDMRHDSYIVGAQLSAKLVKRRGEEEKSLPVLL